MLLLLLLLLLLLAMGRRRLAKPKKVTPRSLVQSAVEEGDDGDGIDSKRGVASLADDAFPLL